MKKFFLVGLVLAALFIVLAPAQAKNGGLDQLSANLTVFDRLAKGLAKFETPDFQGVDANRLDAALDALFGKVGHGFRPGLVLDLEARINTLNGNARIVLTASNNVIRAATRDGKTVRWLRIHPTKVRMGNVRIEMTNTPPTNTAKGVSIK